MKAGSKPEPSGWQLGGRFATPPEDLPALVENAERAPSLLDRTAHGGKDVVGAGSNQSNRAYHHSEYYSQHYRIFRDILAILFPQPVQSTDHSVLTLFLYPVSEIHAERANR